MDPTYFEAKLKPHEETSFSLHVSPEVIAEVITALKARNISSIYLEIPHDIEEYIFWERAPHRVKTRGNQGEAPYSKISPKTIPLKD